MVQPPASMLKERSMYTDAKVLASPVARKRSLYEEECDGEDDHPGRRSKRPRNVLQLQPSLADERFSMSEGCFPLTPRKLIRSEPLSPSVVKSAVESGTHLLARDALETAHGLRVELVDARARICQLEQARTSEQQENKRLEAQVRQDMYLEMLQYKEKAQRAIDSSVRQLSQARVAIDHLKEESELAKQALDRLRVTSAAERNVAAEYRAACTANRAEVQHLQAVNTVLESDLQELRQLEDEAAEARRQRRAHLPPAYGSLDEEDTPHEDAGSTNLANLRHVTRKRFKTKTQQTSRKLEDVRFAAQIRNYSSKNAFFLHSLLSELNQVCQSLKRCFKSAARPDMDKIWASTEAQCALPDDRKEGGELHHAGQLIPASDVVEMIISFAWHSLAACELSLFELQVSSREQRDISIQGVAIDAVLLAALRECDGTDRESRNLRIWDLQSRLTQLNAIDRGLLQLSSGMQQFVTRVLFTKSRQWLEEVIETERVVRANCTQEDREQAAAREHADSAQLSAFESAMLGGPPYAEDLS